MFIKMVSIFLVTSTRFNWGRISLISRIIFALEAGSNFCRVALNSVFSIFGTSGAAVEAVFDAEAGFALAPKLTASGLRFKRF